MKPNITFIKICSIALFIFVFSYNFAEAYIFTRNLSEGAVGEDVRMLQRILNSNPATRVASSGVGSPSQETNQFGYLTKNAVVKYQNLYAAEILYPVGLTAGNGVVGPSTRTHLSKIPGFGDVLRDDAVLLSNTSTQGLSYEQLWQADFNRWINYLNSGGAKAINDYVNQLGSGGVVENKSSAIVNSLSAESVGTGQKVVAFGFYFPHDLEVTLGSTKVLTSVNSIATQAEFIVPSNLSGKVDVKFSSPTKTVTQNNFTLDISKRDVNAPEITAVPKSIVFGKSATIKGKNFDTKDKNTVTTPFGSYEVVAKTSKSLTFKMDTYEEVRGYEDGEEHDDEGEVFEGFIFIQNKYGNSNMEDVDFIVD